MAEDLSQSYISTVYRKGQRCEKLEGREFHVAKRNTGEQN